jgi:hypothetical protein
MQKLRFGLQATDPARSTRQRAGRYFGLLVGVLLAGHAFSVSAFAQTVTSPLKPKLPPEEQKIPLAPQTEEEWRKAMSRSAPPHKGCFTAAYPKMDWMEVKCAPVTAGPHYPSSASGVPAGNSTTFIAIGTGSLSAAIGSFDSVTGATSVTDSMSGPDKFSLQLNTNFFPVIPLCPADPNALTGYASCGWQQFVFAAGACGGQDCVYIEYWLTDYDWSSTHMCPNGWDKVVDGNRIHCRHKSLGDTVAQQSITSLKEMTLSGSLQLNSTSDPSQNTVTVIFAGGSGAMGMIADGDFLDVGANFYWQETEFNIFGQDQASKAQLSPGTTLVVRTQIDDQAGNLLPTCIQLGFTRESNNLHVTGRPTITKAQYPSIAFQESNTDAATTPDCAASVGDTHLMTFDGLFYDFQAVGEFLLAQPAPDFIVQTQQVSGAPNWPNAAINKAVGVKLGKSQVAICLNPYRLELDGKAVRLDRGKSLSLPGDVILFRKGDTYFIGRPGGDVVRADVNNNEYIDVSVGHASGAAVAGLLGNANAATADDIAIQGGAVLTQPVSFTDLYGRYADSWRVKPNASLLCKGQKIETGKPGAPLYAGNLTQSQYNSALGVCTTAGVKDPTLLEACILDVTVIGNNNAANVFAGLTPPVSVMRVQIAGSVPAGGIGAPPGVTQPGGTPLQVPK